MASNSTSLTATGSLTFTRDGEENRATFYLSGTYGTVTALVEVSNDSFTTYFPIAVLKRSDRTWETSTLSPTDNLEIIYDTEWEGWKGIRLRVTAIASGTVAVGGHTFVGPPLPADPSVSAPVSGVTAGTAAAGKAVVLGNSKEIATITSATITTLTADAIVAGDSSLGVAGQAAAQGGAVAIVGGVSSTSTNAGGAVSMIGAIGTTTAVGGEALVRGGAGTGAAVGGAAKLEGGLGGSSTTVGVGGAATVTAGAGQATAAGGIASLVAGASGSGATGNGGVAKVTGGAAASTDGNGGAVILTPGALAGTGKTGHVIVRNANIWRTFLAPEADLGAGNDTITVAMLQKGYCSITPTDADTLTTPTGTEIDAAFALQDLAADDSFDFSVLNNGVAGSDDVITMTAGASGVTITGCATIAGATASLWRFRRTATATYIVYKIAG